jgi:hypothetical protein
LSIACSEVFGEVYFIRSWSWKVSVARMEVAGD